MFNCPEMALDTSWKDLPLNGREGELKYSTPSPNLLHVRGIVRNIVFDPKFSSDVFITSLPLAIRSRIIFSESAHYRKVTSSHDSGTIYSYLTDSGSLWVRCAEYGTHFVMFDVVYPLKG